MATADGAGALPATPATPEAAERRISLLVRDVSVTYRFYHPAGDEVDRSGRLTRLRPRRLRAVPAVRSISFTVYEGEAVGVVGPNGSGKSSLMRAVAGVLPTTSGEVLASSSPVLVGVRAALVPDVSGRRNIYLGASALGLSRREVAALLDETIEFAGVGKSIDLPLSTYSSGMRARLHFAIATMVNPEILLVDEALSVGDAEFRAKSEERLQKMLTGAKTVLFVSHGMRSVNNLCSRVIWLDKGEVRMDGPAEEVIDAYLEEVRRKRAAERAS